MDVWNEEFRKYYQKYKANYRNPQIKQRFRKITRWRKHRVKCLDRRMGSKIQHHSTLPKNQQKES